MTDTRTGTEDTSQEGGQEQPKVFDAEYVAELRKENAKYRTEAKANAEAAKRLAELEESNKSESQKQADRIAALEQQIAEANLQAMRSQKAAKYHIDPDDAALFLTGTDEATVEAQAKRWSERTSERKKKSGHVPKEGNVTNPTDSDDREFARQLFGRA